MTAIDAAEDRVRRIVREEIEAADERRRDAEAERAANGVETLIESLAKRAVQFGAQAAGIGVSGLMETFEAETKEALPLWTRGLTPKAGRILEQAMTEALLLGQNKIEPHHLLLALIRIDDPVVSVAVKLGDLGDLRKVRQAVIATLGGAK